MATAEKNSTVLIVDDERLAREKLKKVLRSFSEVELLGEADDVKTATDILEKQSPDLIFLDIHLGSESGFDIVPAVPDDTQIIFVTAYDQYAVRAFEINALDYLLKPVRKQRMQEAMQRIRNRDAKKKSADPPVDFSYEDTIFINTPDVCKFLKLSSITSIDADGSYSHIYEKEGENYAIHKSLGEWEAILDSSHFVRIHRSHIVNKNYIEDVEKWFNYTYRVRVKNREEELPMSRRRAGELKI